MCIRIQLSRATVKDLHRRLQHAYRRDEVRLVRRTTVLLDLLVHHVPVAVLRERWGLRQAWLQDAWPTMLRAAQRRKGLMLFEDEASVAPWGS